MSPPKTAPCRFDHRPFAEGTGPAAAELLRRVAASLAHNVNNALCGVIGCLELVLREAEPGTPLYAHLSEALRGAWRAAERVRRATAYARGAEIRLDGAVCLRRAAEASARRAADYSEVTVLVRAPDTPCLVQADEVPLQLVLEQLVSNAVEAMPGGGTLVLRAWDDGHRRCLSLADEGPGLSPEVRRRLFEPFFTTKAFGHLGIGLALCRDIIEAQGGAIHVTGAEGNGTTVTLSFPPSEEADDTPTTSAASPSAYAI